MTAAEFKNWIVGRDIVLIEQLNGLAVGDQVTFTNEFGISFPGFKIVGIADDSYDFYNRRFFLDKEAYWFPVRESELTLEKKAHEIQN